MTQVILFEHHHLCFPCSHRRHTGGASFFMNSSFAIPIVFLSTKSTV
jgi:hypothetical protein